MKASFRFASIFIGLMMLAQNQVAEAQFKYIMRLGPREKKKFVDAHNKLRSSVNPSASNMRMLEWDEKIAKQSEIFVRECNFSHSSPQMKTNEFPKLGENIYGGSEYYYSIIMTEVPKRWYSEVTNYDISGKQYKCKPGKVCGHYKQVVWANSKKMGCAIAKCEKIHGGHGHVLVTCHYGPPGNIYLEYPNGTLVEVDPYRVGDPCTQCRTDEKKCSENLCHGE